MASYPGDSIFDIITKQYVPSTASGQTDTFVLSPSGQTSQQIDNIKIKSIYGDYTYTNASQSSLFDDLSAHDTHMCIRIFHGNLTISSGTLQPTYRCRGMILFVKGSITNSGIISMTGWGAPTALGENVYLMTNSLTIQTVQAAGGGSGSSVFQAGSTGVVSGSNGTAGSGRRTGGGGSGSAWNIGTGSATGSAGTAGTSYCGGFGGGSAHTRSATTTGGTTTSAGGGNAAMVFTTQSASISTAGGGSGLVGGTGRQVAANSTTTTTLTTGATVGTVAAAGLLVIYCLGNFTNNSGATLESAGKNGGQGSHGSGGSSGGGSVNVFYRGTASTSISNRTAIDVTGGSAITLTSNSSFTGGSGGAGTKNADAIVATVRQFLVKVGSDYYYYRFDTSAWTLASGATTEEKFRNNGMLEGELYNINRSKLAQLSGIDLSSVTVEQYVTT